MRELSLNQKQHTLEKLLRLYEEFEEGIATKAQRYKAYKLKRYNYVFASLSTARKIKKSRFNIGIFYLYSNLRFRCFRIPALFTNKPVVLYCTKALDTYK